MNYVTPTRIDLTPEQRAALAPLFEVLAANHPAKLSIVAQVTQEAAFVVVLPAAPARKVQAALSEYKSSIAALQPSPDETGEAYRAYTAHVQRGAVSIGPSWLEGEDVTA